MIVWEKDSVWIWEWPGQTFYKMTFGARMTAIRLKDGGLFVHSPIPLVETVKAEIDALGPVRALVSPNKLHHLHLGPWAQAYPQARLFASPGLAAKRPDLAFHAALGEAPDPLWAGQIDQAILQGSPLMAEVVFFHPSSRTLLVADMMEYFGPHTPSRLTRWLVWLAGMYGRPVMPPDWRLSFRGGRDALRQALARILAWDFDRVILAHGKLIESQGRDTVRRVFAWALEA